MDALPCLSVTVSLSGKGQLSLPVSVREALGLSRGDRLTVEVEGGVVTLRRALTPDEIAGRTTALVAPGTAPLTDVDGYFQAHRAGGEVSGSLDANVVLERHYSLARHDVCEALLALSALPAIVMSGAAQAALRVYPGHPKLSFEDCLLVAAARDERAEPLWTFDRKLANQSDASLVV